MKYYLLIIFIFLIFILFQIYFYNNKYIKNGNTLQKVESFESKLININNNNYLLDDNSIKLLLEDYNNLKIK